MTEMADDIPRTYEEVMKSEDPLHWQAAIERELESLKENEVYEVIQTGDIDIINLVDAKWVFAKKSKDVFKARLVIRGFKDITPHGIEEIYSPVPKLETMRLMISVAVNNGYKIIHLDVVAAFQHSKINYNVFVRPAAGTECTPNTLWRLKRSLYGLLTAAKD